ncbi:hypothetical protein MKX01_030837 [Papaver californicum]|nr:hypothetical protein MKX01_030837 [Papaver californicum]
MPLHRPGLQMGVTDMQAWQQKIMYTQLQDIQMQRQLDQESRELNRMNQLSATSNQSAGDLLPRQGNGLHIHDATSNFWPAEHMGGDSKVPTTPEMPIASNTNGPHHNGSSAMQRYSAGLISSLEQGQVPHSMGFVPNQLDQSLYGTPIASIWGALDQYSDIPADMLTKGNASAEDLRWRQQQAGWPENTQENNGWDASSGGSSTVTGGYGNSLENSEPFNGFSSMQSGTWSALMQSAVAETSSNDTGIQGEWSGLSSPRTQMPTGALSATTGDSSKKRKDWADQNMHHVSSVTSKPFQLFDDSNMNLTYSIPNSQQLGTTCSEEQRNMFQHSASREYAGQSPGGSINWLNHSSEQTPHPRAEDSYPVQPRMHPEKSAGAAWPGQIYEESRNAAHSWGIGLNAQNMDGSWIHGHKLSSDKTEIQPWNRQNGLRTRELPSDNGIVSLKMHENDSTMQHNQTNDLKIGMHMVRNRDGGMWNGFANHHDKRESSHMRKSTAGSNSDVSKVNQPAIKQVQNSNHLELGNHVDFLVEYRGDDTTENRQNQVNQKEISNESYNSNQSHQIVLGGPRETSLLSPSDSRSLGRGNKKSASQVGRKVSGVRKFQYHPMGDLGANVEPVDKRVQNLPEHVSGGSRGMGQGYSGYPNFAGQISNNSAHIQEGKLLKSLENPKETVELAFRGAHLDSTAPSLFDGSTDFYAQNKSQHMLELLHKVDQSRETNSSTPFGSSSECEPQSKMPEPEVSGVSSAHLRCPDQSSASQGFGLCFAPLTQGLPVQNHAFPSQKATQTVTHLKSRQVESDVGGQGQTWLSPTSSVQLSSRDHWESRSGISGVANETLQQKIPAGTFTDTLPCQRHQLQHQQVVSGASENIKTDQPVTFSGLPSHSRHTSDTSIRILPFNLSQVHHSQLMGSDLRVPAPPLPVLESTAFANPSVSSGLSWQGSFSTTLKNASSPQCAGSSALSISTSNRNMGRTSWVQKQDYQCTKKVGDSKHYANGEEQTGKKSSLQEVYLDRETSTASRGQKSSGKHLPDANSIASDSLAVHPHHQALDRRCGKDPILVQLLQNQGSSKSRVEAFGQSLKVAHVPHQNLSLPQQVQNMEHTETDPDVRNMKRFKGSDAGHDTQQIATLKPDQQPFDGSKITVKYGNNEVTVTTMQKSFLSKNGRVHNYTSEAREDTNSSQHIPKDLPYQDVSAFSGHKNSQDRSIHHNLMSTKPKNSQISPQMAPSWFEQYGTYKNGKMLLVNNARKLEENTWHLLPANSSESLNSRIAMEPANVFDTSQSIVTTLVASEHVTPPHSLPSQVTDQSLSVMKPKKRKSESLDLLSWHKEVMCGSQRLLNIRIAEKDWAHATHRLFEKVEDEVEMFEDGPQRRLISTTQLMQQLLRPSPPAILSADATSSYESVVYFIAKVALEDACSMIPSTGSDLSSTEDNRNQTYEELKLSERLGDKYFSKVVEEFSGRVEKLESDLFRLDTTCSILDIRVESQELERISVINRFAKFHTRSQQDGADNSFSSIPQRYVISLLMPKNPPQGVQCLSL